MNHTTKAIKSMLNLPKSALDIVAQDIITKLLDISNLNQCEGLTEDCQSEMVYVCFEEQDEEIETFLDALFIYVDEKEDSKEHIISEVENSLKVGLSFSPLFHIPLTEKGNISKAGENEQQRHYDGESSQIMKEVMKILHSSLKKDLFYSKKSFENENEEEQNIPDAHEI